MDLVLDNQSSLTPFTLVVTVQSVDPEIAQLSRGVFTFDFASIDDPDLWFGFLEFTDAGDTGRLSCFVRQHIAQLEPRRQMFISILLGRCYRMRNHLAKTEVGHGSVSTLSTRRSASLGRSERSVPAVDRDRSSSSSGTTNLI